MKVRAATWHELAASCGDERRGERRVIKVIIADLPGGKSAFLRDPGDNWSGVGGFLMDGDLEKKSFEIIIWRQSVILPAATRQRGYLGTALANSERLLLDSNGLPRT